MKKDPQSIVIGAGIVGICTALYLQEQGRQVTLIDRLAPGEGTSSGNAGIISVGSVHPEAMPGIYKDIPHMLLQRSAPITVRPAYMPRMLPWFCRFLSNSSSVKAEQSSIGINELSSKALDYLAPLVKKSGGQALLRQEGALNIYETQAQFAQAKLNCAYYDRRGVDYQIVEGPQLTALEPSLRPGLAGGVLVSSAAHTVSPLALSRSLFTLFEKQGGQFIQAEVTGFITQGKQVTTVKTDREFACQQAFVTAGAYSRTLAKQLGSSVLLDTERGYNLQLPSPGLELKRPLLFAGRAFAATSMLDGLRLAGTVEFAGLKASPNYARAHRLAAQAAYLFPQLNVEGGEPWMGYRPSMPDTVPVISRSPNFDNVFYGFGHGHLGLTQAAVTGAMLSAMATGGDFPVGAEQFRIDRTL
ncbi:MAG: D-amino-acid dehydrogenase [Paraglaciecola sp.]|jgi:D-amino-acid dehydrogenase